MSKYDKAIFFCAATVWYLCAVATVGYSLGYTYGDVVQKIARA